MQNHKKYQESLGSFMPSLGPANKNLDAAVDALVDELKQKIKEAMPQYNPVGFFGRIRNWWKENQRRGQAIQQGKEYAPTDPRYIHGTAADFDGGYDAQVSRQQAVDAEKKKRSDMWAKLGQKRESNEMPLELWNLYQEHIDEIVKLVQEAAVPPHPIDSPSSPGVFNTKHYKQPEQEAEPNAQQKLGMYLADFKQKIKDLVMQYRSNRYLTHGIRDIDGWSEPQRPAGGGNNPEWDHWAREHWFKNKDRTTGYQFVPGAEEYAKLRQDGANKVDANKQVEMQLRGMSGSTAPTPAPSGSPTPAPSGSPTPAPSGSPTPAPSGSPTPAPSGSPTPAPAPPASDPAPTAPTASPPPDPGDAPGIGKTADEIKQLLNFDDDIAEDDAKSRVKKLIPNIDTFDDMDKVDSWKDLLTHLKQYVELADDIPPDEFEDWLQDTAKEYVAHFYGSGTADGMVDHYLQKVRNTVNESVLPFDVSLKLRKLNPSDKVKYLKSLMSK